MQSPSDRDPSDRDPSDRGPSDRDPSDRAEKTVGPRESWTDRFTLDR